MIPNRQLVATEDQATSSTASADWAASIGEQDVRRWAEAFAAESFGDPLIAAALSLLLLPAVPYQLQVPSHVNIVGMQQLAQFDATAVVG